MLPLFDRDETASATLCLKSAHTSGSIRNNEDITQSHLYSKTYITDNSMMLLKSSLLSKRWGQSVP